MTQQTVTEPKFTVGQHVHVDTPPTQRLGVVAEIFVADPATQTHACAVLSEINLRLEHVYRVTANEGDALFVVESQLSSCDLAAELRRDIESITAQRECERKIDEQAAVNDTLRSVISALQRAAADLQSVEIDEYADLDVIASSAALDEIGSAAAALIGVVAVMCDSNPADGNWDDQAHHAAAQLRTGHAVSVVR